MSAYSEGYNAYENNKSEDSCPYDPEKDDSAYHLWLSGWGDASSDEDDDYYDDYEDEWEDDDENAGW
jgi:ribosome modulation factor